MSRKAKRLSRREAHPGSQTAKGIGPRRSFLGQEFNPDYSYVIKDLRRIGTLAGTFFLILIVLSFFLR